MGYKYMIHTCNRRRWYVNKFLIPEMLAQGIKKADIIVAVDSKYDGILLSTMQMFDWIGRSQDWNDIIWHLQDDIILSSSFAERTSQLYGDIICGFCSSYDESKKFGAVEPREMWYSFPCIAIKNYVAKECANWFFNSAVYDTEYKPMIAARKYADHIFREYILKKYDRPVHIFNAKPNLVDHIDYLIGGSTVNAQRTERQIRAWYWNEENRVRDLQKNIEQMFD